MNPPEAIKQIEEVLAVMKTVALPRKYQIASSLFRLADSLSVLDAQLSIALKEKLVEILSLTDAVAIGMRINEAEQLLEQLNAKIVVPARPRTFLGISRKVYGRTNSTSLNAVCGA